jgi:hypothetical protein
VFPAIGAARGNTWGFEVFLVGNLACERVA